MRNNIERKYIHQHFVYTLKHELKKMYYMDNEQQILVVVKINISKKIKKYLGLYI